MLTKMKANFYINIKTHTHAHTHDLFKEMGLNTNKTKTKFMVLRGTAAPKALPLKLF